MAMPSRDLILWLIRGHLINQLFIKPFLRWAKPLCKSRLSLIALGICWLVIYALPLTWALLQHTSSLPTHILSPICYLTTHRSLLTNVMIIYSTALLHSFARLFHELLVLFQLISYEKLHTCLTYTFGSELSAAISLLTYIPHAQE